MSLLSPSTRALRALRWQAHHHSRLLSCTARQQQHTFFDPATTNASPTSPPTPKIDPTHLLSTPSWSPTSLLPSPNAPLPPILTPTLLDHLLRLSALPPPSSPEEEASLLSTLAQQLHFVRQIQDVDTTGVEPLTGIRDETEEGRREGEFTLSMLEKVMQGEDVRGRYAPRRRRRKLDKEVVEGQGHGKGKGELEEWDVLGNAERKVGRYFVVEKGTV
ncbi:hypothetical protein KVT40_004579 [Elsinoe batatas]|uniref:Glutamyl-tRNA amidotransferase complex subunit Gta3 domain-containing protein n=1 Tax=Elsinoe batatas TaxID=2601811 RepID=A0A8K0L3M0_9PEZI|nr:hypothetical protein KVT40_004579 [Elsinoe batatas]